MAIVFVNNFNDLEIDHWETCRRLRHELAHAGSIRKAEFHPDKLATTSRAGGLMLSEKRGNNPFGLALDEGFHAFEDRIFENPDSSPPQLSGFNIGLSNGDQLFPNARKKFSELRHQLISQGEIGPDRDLVSHRTENQKTITVAAGCYTEYVRLLEKIFLTNPKLIELTRDFIYGDRAIAFAREINDTFGEGFFKKIMSVGNEADAKKMTEELLQSQPEPKAD